MIGNIIERSLCFGLSPLAAVNGWSALKTTHHRVRFARRRREAVVLYNANIRST